MRKRNVTLIVFAMLFVACPGCSKDAANVSSKQAVPVVLTLKESRQLFHADMLRLLREAEIKTAFTWKEVARAYMTPKELVEMERLYQKTLTDSDPEAMGKLAAEFSHRVVIAVRTKLTTDSAFPATGAMVDSELESDERVQYIVKIREAADAVVPLALTAVQTKTMTDFTEMKRETEEKARVLRELIESQD